MRGSKGTYNRKYYLHRKIKSSGFSLKFDKCEKIISTTPDMTSVAKNNRYVNELQKDYRYGVQVIIPMT